MPIINIGFRIGGVKDANNLTIDQGEVFTLTVVDAPAQGLEVVDAGDDPILDIVEGPGGKSASITAREPGDSEVQFQLRNRRRSHMDPIWKRFRVHVTEAATVTATITDQGNRPRT